MRFPRDTESTILCFTITIRYESWNEGRDRFQTVFPRKHNGQTSPPPCCPSPCEGGRECLQMVKHSEMTQASPSLNTDDRMVRIPVCSEHAYKHGAIRAAQTRFTLLRGHVVKCQSKHAKT